MLLDEALDFRASFLLARHTLPLACVGCGCRQLCCALWARLALALGFLSALALAVAAAFADGLAHVGACMVLPVLVRSAAAAALKPLPLCCSL